MRYVRALCVCVSPKHTHAGWRTHEPARLQKLSGNTNPNFPKHTNENSARGYRASSNRRECRLLAILPLPGPTGRSSSPLSESSIRDASASPSLQMGTKRCRRDARMPGVCACACVRAWARAVVTQGCMVSGCVHICRSLEMRPAEKLPRSCTHANHTQVSTHSWHAPHASLACTCARANAPGRCPTRAKRRPRQCIPPCHVHGNVGLSFCLFSGRDTKCRAAGLGKFGTISTDRVSAMRLTSDHVRVSKRV